MYEISELKKKVSLVFFSFLGKVFKTEYGTYNNIFKTLIAILGFDFRKSKDWTPGGKFSDGR